MVKGWEIVIFTLVTITFFLLLCRVVFSIKVPWQQPSLSLLLVVRDVEESIEGLVHQIHGFHQRASGAFELVVVDDASIDQTKEILYRLANRYPLVIANSDHCKTPVETGIFQCRGQLICIVDLVGRLRPEEATNALESFFGLGRSYWRSR